MPIPPTITPPSSAKTQPPPAIVVRVEQRAITLPDIPDTVGTAQKGYREALPQLVNGVRDLEQDLAALYAAAPPRSAIPVSLKVPHQRAGEVQFLSRMLMGAEFDRLLAEVRGQWNAWTGFLVENGLAVTTGRGSVAAPRPQPPDRSRQDEELRRRLQLMQQRNSMESDLAELREFCTNPQGEFDQEAYQVLAPQTQEWNQRTAQTIQMAVVSKVQAPRFRETWAPLAAYVRAQAAAWADLEAAQADDSGAPGLEALRAHAKLHFLEQVRASLWLCHQVWARMSSNPGPPPLARLAPLTSLK